MTIITALGKGLAGYDAIVVVLIIINVLFVAMRLKKMSKTLDKHLRKVVYLPVQHALKDLASNEPQKVNLHQLRQMRESEDKLYHSFVSITNILPLLGILGTVIALIRIDGFTADTVSTSFLAALTSTFWGLVGATICKALEGGIVSRVEANRDNLNILIESIFKESGARE